MEKWSFLSSPQAPVWERVGREGSAMSVGPFQGHLEFKQESTSPISRASDSGRVLWAGDLRKRCLLSPRPCAYREPAARSVSLPMSHMKQLLGEKEGEHTSEVSVKIWAWQRDAVHKKRATRGLWASWKLGLKLMSDGQGKGPLAVGMEELLTRPALYTGLSLSFNRVATFCACG